MSKKSSYICQKCGALYGKWTGQCADCGEWNTVVEAPKAMAAMPHHKKTSTASKSGNKAGFAGDNQGVTRLSEVSLTTDVRMSTSIKEFDRVLGGGVVAGSVILIGGDPGIGKSTILLQTATHLAKPESDAGSALYITGEESLAQVALRAARLQLPTEQLQVMAETNVEKICHTLMQLQPAIAVIDSIQTLYTEAIQSAPGGVAQVRESAAMLTRFAKQTGTVLFLVGHVTKEGSLAGPRVLEHMVDTVLYFEGQADSRFRMIRAVKNRFGAVNELGVFAMTDKGIREVANPSAIFLSRYEKPIAGSIVMVSREGTRPLLVEVQALVSDAHAQPRRVALGLDQQRFTMLLAVMQRHGSIETYGQDVYLNVVGGVKVLETGSDLAVLLACASSLKNKPLPFSLAVFGEVGLSGEIRPVPAGQERIAEAGKHGFTHMIVPKANAPKTSPKNVTVHAVSNLSQALEVAFSV